VLKDEMYFLSAKNGKLLVVIIVGAVLIL